MNRLAGEHGPFYAWITGWWNLLGQFGCTAGKERFQGVFCLLLFIMVEKDPPPKRTKQLTMSDNSDPYRN
jgi:hypothetical protein